MKCKIALSVLFAFSGAFAASFNIAEDTVVTESEVASYAGADIDIAEGAVLKFHNLVNSRTFTGKLTGAGTLAIVNDSPTPIRMTLSGNAAGFTGSFAITNHTFTVSSPTALGDTAKFFCKVPQNGSQDVSLYGNILDTEGATYKNEFSVMVGDNTGLRLAKNVTLSGRIQWYGGRLNGKNNSYSSRVTGPLVLMNPSRNIFCQGGVSLAGGVYAEDDSKTAKIFMDGSLLDIGGEVDEYVTDIQVAGSTLNFSADNTLHKGIKMIMGASWKPYATIKLNGNSVCCREITTANITEAYVASTYIESTAPAVFEIADQRSDATYIGNLKGAVSLVYSSSTGKTLKYAGKNGTTTGSITVKSGTFVCSAGASIPNLSRFVLSGTGKLDFEADADSGDPEFLTILNSAEASLHLSDDAKVTVPEGTILEVGLMTHDGVAVPKGDYRANDASILTGHVLGGGVLRVCNSGKETESATFAWKGGQAESAIDAPANWQGGIAPAFDGSERLVFSGGGKAVVSGVLKAFAIDISGENDFRIEAADENAKIILGGGGISLLNDREAPVATHQIACPVELDCLPQTWNIASNTVLENLSPIIGIPTQRPLIVNACGRMDFKADNSTLNPPLVVNITNRKISQPRIYNFKGLGPKTRPATISGAPFLFIIPGTGHFTNETPLRISNKNTGDGSSIYQGVFINDSNKGHLYLAGQVSYFGDYCETYFCGNVHFLGGIVHESNKRIVWRMFRANQWIEGDGFHTTAPFELDYGGILNIAAPCTYSMINPYKCTVMCHAGNVLDPNGEFVFGHDALRSNGSEMDLNGYDQIVGRLWRKWSWTNDGNNYVSIKSATAATLKIENDNVYDDRLPLIMQGGAGMLFDAAGSITFTNYMSTSTGTLSVARGTVSFETGSGWPNISALELSGGSIVLAETVAATAFGTEQGRSNAWMVRDGGTLRIPSGETACVRTLGYRNEQGNLRYYEPGIYGGEGSGLPAGNTLAWIEGGGRLQVLRSGSPATVIFVR